MYYHNTTKSLLNESEFEDFYWNYEEGDSIFKTERGNAILIPMTYEEVIEKAKHDNIVEE